MGLLWRSSPPAGVLIEVQRRAPTRWKEDAGNGFLAFVFIKASALGLGEESEGWGGGRGRCVSGSSELDKHPAPPPSSLLSPPGDPSAGTQASPSVSPQRRSATLNYVSNFS